jgi:uncharacterized protein (DUF433 family)
MNLQCVYQRCAEADTRIVTNEKLLNGVPHIAGTKITVIEILARLYVLGNVKALVKYYCDVTEEQVKDAIFYAHRFMEIACDSNQSRP